MQSWLQTGKEACSLAMVSVRVVRAGVCLIVTRTIALLVRSPVEF